MNTLNTQIIGTQRLALRAFTTDDAAFFMELVNDPAWERFIGKRHLNNLDDTRAAILKGPMAMFERHGFCLYVVELKSDSTAIGICGLIKRDQLVDIDLGFAFLERYRGQGYALEAARATMEYANHTQGLKRIVAITSLDNDNSIALLKKIGFQFESLMTFNTVTPNTPDTKLFAYKFDERTA